MSATHLSPDDLRGVRTLDDVIALLGDALDWPLGDLDLEDVSFEYTPSELGIPDDQARRINDLRQLQKLTVDQPWGIFFVEFDGPRLPVTQLRRLLRALVHKKRASGDGTKATWDLNDLLFVATTGSGEAVELHFIAFAPGEGKTPDVMSVPWRPDQSPDRYLRRIAEELLPHLAWPDDPGDPDEWRTEWREAFVLHHGEVITTTNRLVQRMAETAAALRMLVVQALRIEHGAGPFTELLASVRDELVADVDADRFADMCAQTLVYGALTSRITDPEAFGATPSLAAIPLSNPFLQSFFDEVHTEAVELDLEGTGFEQLVADLRVSNVEAVLDQFGATADGGDPVIHLYEDFLALYDNKQRVDAGAFYTPVPVVRFIIRAVDEIMRTRFGLAAGIADDATWGEVVARLGQDLHEGVASDAPFVSMIDPAAGTGTFLVEWIRQAKRSFLETHPQADWDAHLREHVLPSMHAFELMLAPYAIAHLKVALELEDAGAAIDDLFATILLTDTLDHPKSAQKLDGLGDPVAAEGLRAETVKENARFTAIVGNPPYDRVAKEDGGGWVVHGDDGHPAIFDDVVKTANSRTIFSHVASLYNLYAYFWRWSIWKAFEQHGDGPAVVALITGASWLDAPGFVGLRELVRDTCDEVFIVDLGGNNRGAEKEENVFDIETPVAVAILVRHGVPTATPAVIRYHRIRGTRAEKVDAISALDLPKEAPGNWFELDSLPWQAFRPVGTDQDWLAMPALTDLLAWQQPGTKLNRTWPVAVHPEVLEQRWDAFLTNTDDETRADLFPNPRSGRTIWTQVGSRVPLADLKPGSKHEPIAPYAWRAFDRQWVLNDPRLAGLERPALWQSRSDQQVYLLTDAGADVASGPALIATTAVPDLHAFRGRGGKDVIPLYRDASATSPNVPRGLLSAILNGMAEPSDRTPALSVEDVAAYVYALLCTPGYQERFAEQLSDKVVRVPMTAEPGLWLEAVALGRQLLWLHTFAERMNCDEHGRDDRIPDIEGLDWAAQVGDIPEAPSEISYDATRHELHVGDGVVSGVLPEVWEYQVSGWPVVRRWLEHRTWKGRGRRSSDLDDIRPEYWYEEWDDELLDLLRVLTHTVETRPAQDDLLDRILAGPLIPADALPTPTDAERQVPATEKAPSARGESLLDD